MHHPLPAANIRRQLIETIRIISQQPERHVALSTEQPPPALLTRAPALWAATVVMVDVQLLTGDGRIPTTASAPTFLRSDHSLIIRFGHTVLFAQEWAHVVWTLLLPVAIPLRGFRARLLPADIAH